MLVLVINAGSSSLKYQLINTETGEKKAKGLAERIGIDGVLKCSIGEHKSLVYELEMPTHKEAVEQVLKMLTHEETKVIDDIKEIQAIGHRIVHGGEYFDKSVLIDDKVKQKIRNLIPLAPLHNSAHLVGINICMSLMPNIPNVAVFDTAFHQTMEEEVFLYGVPHEDYTEYNLRKYGFHGTSHYYVSQQAIKLLNKKNTKVIVCHLGNGSSICAVENGKSVMTSMGLTPLEGVMMGTRSGDIDAGVIPYLMERKKMTSNQIIDYLNKKSGLLGVSGISSDLREVSKAAKDGDHRAKVAIEMMCSRIKRYVSSYAGLLGGVDAICFTAGIGENADFVREKVCTNLEFMGIEFDKIKNKEKKTGIKEISKKTSRTKIYVIPTEEELVIAKDTDRIVKDMKK